jgi:hypothetical protein
MVVTNGKLRRFISSVLCRSRFKRAFLQLIQLYLFEGRPLRCSLYRFDLLGFFEQLYTAVFAEISLCYGLLSFDAFMRFVNLWLKGTPRLLLVLFLLDL